MQDQNRKANWTRRDFLKGFTFGAAGVGLSATGLGYFLTPAQAQDAPPTFGSFLRTTIGAFTVTIIQDGTGQFGYDILAANADPDELAAVLEANNLPNTPPKSTFNVMVIDAGDRRVLLDTGNGVGAGQLIPTLDVLGLPADSITDVIISHIHPDHVGGVSNEGTINFPNATFHIGETEHNFLTTGAENFPPLAQLIEGATAKLQPVIDAGSLNIMPDEGEWLPGITAVPAFGHTPGQLNFLIESDGDALLAVMDTANNAVVSLARTDWALAFDTIPEQAAETRRAILGRAATEQLKTFGYHFAFPGVGYVVAEGEGFRFVPINA